MKAVFLAEAIGFGGKRAGRAFDYDRGGRTPWVAELTGLCPTYGYQRSFLTAKVDWRHMTSSGARGAMFAWTLELGKVYETRYRVTWRQWVTRFLVVGETGEIKDVTEGEVREWLGNVASVWTS